MGKPIYFDHLEALAAFITQLALHKQSKRMVQGIAKESQFHERGVSTVLDSFHGIFKKYHATRLSDEALYLLRDLHALQSSNSDESAEPEPLDSQYHAILLEFASHRAQDESQWRTSCIVAWVGAGVAVFAAIASIFAALT